jgi:thioredoxin-like negative regulator of GroEL
MIEVVKFFLPSCGPCKAMQPMLDSLTHQFKDKDVKFSYIDASEDVARARSLGIKSAPTVIIFKDDAEKARFEGARHRMSEYSDTINNLLNEGA